SPPKKKPSPPPNLKISKLTHLTPLPRVVSLLEPGPILLVTTGSLPQNILTLGFHSMLQHSSPILITTVLGLWDASFNLLKQHKQFVLDIPDVSIAQTVVDIGNCSVNYGINQWEKFKNDVKAKKAEKVDVPLVGGKGIIGNVECKVENESMVEKYNLWALRVVNVWVGQDWEKKKMIHRRWDGKFSVDGEKILDLSERMVKWEGLLD
ncbi:hypothetical protein QBC38DRAFT_372970, partial [Podospora fimiseda]